MTQLGFRARLFLILALFAIAPALLITLAWGGTMTRLLPLMAGKAAWDTVSTTGEQALAIAKRAARTPADSTMIAEHGRALATAHTGHRPAGGARSGSRRPREARTPTRLAHG